MLRQSATLASLAALFTQLWAQQADRGHILQGHPAQVPAIRIQIIDSVDDARRTVLKGNIHPLTNATNDRGVVSQSQTMRRMLLMLSRSPEQQLALDKLMKSQQEPGSQLFHKWLTPEQFGDSFGPASQDVQSITSWLASHGFTDISVGKGRTVIEFSGNAGQVQNAFHTAIHRYQVNGDLHLANQSDPSIPTALVPVVAGVVSLNDFGRRSMVIRGPTLESSKSQFRPQVVPGASPDFTVLGPTFQSSLFLLSPYDFATIYDLQPLWKAGFDGTGQTIAIVGQTDINLNDMRFFRSFLGLPAKDPTVLLAGSDPGVLPDEIESDLDVEWSGAVAKGANIEFVTAASTEATSGVDLAAQYIVDNNLAPVMSESYGECELFLGTTANAFYSALWQQAAAEGITVLVSSGDQGSAACDPMGIDANLAVHPMAVSGLASTPYNVAVGGSDFNQFGLWTQYWSQTNDPVTKQSALGYIPEIPWNDSCGSTIVAAHFGQDPTTDCTDGGASALNNNTVATGGGPSSCVSSNGTDPTTCKGGWPKPVWQAGTGVPADGVRDIPDVSLFAGDASQYNSAYLVCDVDLSGGSGCDPSASIQTFIAVGGTSGSAPAMAGVMAIINQKYGRQGNANYTLYRLALSANASSIFHDITLSNNRVACTSLSADCQVPAGAAEPLGRMAGHDSTIGYDMVTGLGTIDIANLVNNWTSIAYAPTTTTLKLNGGTNTVNAVHGSAINAIANVTTASGIPSGDVSLLGSAASGGFYLGPLQSGSASGIVNSLPGGSYTVTAHYAGDTQFAPSDSSSVNVSISPEPSTTKVTVFNYDPAQGTFVPPASVVPYGSLLLLRADVKGSSGYGNATGSATFTDGSTSLGKFTLNAEGYTESAPSNLLMGGIHGISASFGGDASFNASSSGTDSITVSPAPMACTLQANTPFLRPGWVLISTARVEIYQSSLMPTLGTMVPPTGTMSVYSGSTLVSGPTAVTGNGSGTLNGGGFQLPGAYINASASASQFTSNAPVTMTYSGDPNYAGCTSAPVQIPYQTSPMPPQFGVKFSAIRDVVAGTTITATTNMTSGLPPEPFEPPYPIPTGTIQVALDGSAVGTPIQLVADGSMPDGTGSPTFSTAGLSPGSHTVAIVYSGDVNYQAARSADFDLEIVVPDFFISTSTKTLSVANGQTTAPVAIQLGTLNSFSGTVNFSCSGLPSQSSCVFTPPALASAGNTTMTITTTQAQSVNGGAVARNQPRSLGWALKAMELSAAFVVMLVVPKRKRKTLTLLIVATGIILPGTMSCGGGSGGSSPIQTAPNQTFTSLAADTTTPAKGSTDTFTATVSSLGSTSIPSGTVQFSLDGAASGTSVTLNQGAAKYQTSFSVAGAHTVTAAYSGDANNLSSTSGNLTVTVPYSTGSLPGTYAVAITATSGTLTHSVPLTLQVQ